MVIRFFSVFLKKYTYELEYSMEIVRMIMINLVFIGIPAIVFRVVVFPKIWVSELIFVLIFIIWSFFVRYSVGRFLQIKKNRKNKMPISKSITQQILDTYPSQPIYAKVNGKYMKIKSSEDVRDEDVIVLVTIGDSPFYEFKKIKKILESQSHSMSEE